jgi:hypothetical protein
MRMVKFEGNQDYQYECSEWLEAKRPVGVSLALFSVTFLDVPLPTELVNDVTSKTASH